MAGDQFSAGTPTPPLWVTRPESIAHAIDRPEVWDQITDAVNNFRVTLVLAPAGFGKTAALSAWAAQCYRRVGWLSLTAADRHSAHLQRGVATLLEALSRTGGGDTHTDDAAQQATGAEQPVAIIDDIQFADSVGSRKLLAELLRRTDLGVRLVLAGRYEPQLGLSRLRAGGELGQIPPDRLVFSTDEVHSAAAALGRETSIETASQLVDYTAGWPVAVRLALMSQPGPGGLVPNHDEHPPQFVDYLVENLLDELPARLAAFVPRACVCDRLNASLAQELSGDSRGAELLEEAVAVGLPLERRTLPNGELFYLWHPVVAQTGRAILLRRDPELILNLHRRAARILAATDPYEAVNHALGGRDPGLAAEVICSQWLALVLRGDSELVNDMCGRLPSPWSEDPEVLTIQAACRRNLGDSESALQLAGRAAAGTHGLDQQKRQRLEETHKLARLFLADDGDEVASACDQVLDLLTGPNGFDGPLRACATLLVGWSKMRLRRSHEAIALLNEAEQRCKAEQLGDLAERARADLLFSKAWSGDFAGALIGTRAAATERDRSTWRGDDGGIDPFTRGWVAFWSGDSDSAMAEFSHAISHCGPLSSFEPLSRVWYVHAALARGSAAEVANAEKLLNTVPEDTIQGLPWGHYKDTARAAIALYHGDRDGAVRFLDQADQIEALTPANRVFVAELYWRCRCPDAARAQTAQILEAPTYLRASGLVIRALCARGEGDLRTANDLLDEALGLGVRLGITRPFQLPDRALTDLLVEHAARGTRFEAFLAERIAESLYDSLRWASTSS